MRDYFKARIAWGAGLSSLSDAEAGRLCKALWAYADSGETICLEGIEGAMLSMFSSELRKDLEHFQKVSLARSKDGTASGLSRRTNANKTSICKQNEHMLNNQTNVHDTNICKQNEQMPTYVQQKEKEVGRACVGDGFLTDEEADSLAGALQDVYDAAERAGFPTNPATLDKLTALAAEYSPPRVISALDVATERGKTSICYLRGILERKSSDSLTANKDSSPLPVFSFGRTDGEPEGIEVPGMPHIRLV